MPACFSIAPHSTTQAEEDKAAAQALLSSEVSRVEREWAAKAESQLRQAQQEAEARAAAELQQLRSQLAAQGGAAEAALRGQMEELRKKLEGDIAALKAAHATV